MLSTSLSKNIKRVPDTIICSITNPSPSYFNPFSFTHADLDLDIGLENLYKLESIGIKEEKDKGSIDECFERSFHDSIIFKEGRYHVEIPWYEDILKQVPSNFKIALASMYRVKQSLLTKNLDQIYSDVFRNYLSLGIIEPIQISSEDYHKYVWIPHRPIFKVAEQVSTKVRPVFNCSLRIKDSPSLNQACYPGIDLMASLFKLLLQFRTNRYVVLADISKAFLQIRLKKEEDRNRFCFFWEMDGTLCTFRYTSIIFGLSVSPYILNAIIRFHSEKYESDLCSYLMKNNLYIDNFIFSSSSLETLFNVFQTITSRLAEGGFDLCSWNSNSHELCSFFQSKDKFVKHQSQEERVLGYLYDKSSDSIKLNDFEFSSVFSKRQLLSQISKVFDPLSLFLPVTIRGRLLMRETWNREMGWDENIGLDLNSLWEELRKDLTGLKEISFPRSCFETESKDLNLHVFCDASPKCYGFVIYISSTKEGPKIFWSKGKVSPLKGRTLPTLELLSVYLAFKCIFQVLDGFLNTKFNNFYIFSDSQITLHWILKGSKANKIIFVKNRIQDIHKMIISLKENYNLSSQFHYVKSEENPADLLTRGLSLSNFVKHLPFWSKGPEWLSFSQLYWPEPEWEKSSKNQSFVLSTIQTNPTPPLFQWEKFSNLHCLLRVCSLLFKFSSLTRKLDQNNDAKAQLYCLKRMQLESFSKEIAFLKRAKENPSLSDPVPDLVNHLNLFLDEKNLIRSKGRLSRSNYYNYDVLNPVLLGKHHYFTALFIKATHYSCKHLGIQATLTNIRLKGFWVTSARAAVKRIISDCMVCKKYNAFAFQYPKFTNYSKAQVELFRPFKHVGVDFTKHWWVKVKGSTQAQKMFIIIYVCLNIRAIHLDLISDMSTDSFIKSFQRFVCRFGVPDVVYSDNAKSFIQGMKTFEAFVTSENGQEFLRQNQIVHRRVSLYSPWTVSLWERLLRVVKDCLVKVIGRNSIDYFQFITVLSEITDAINSRPLTYTSSSLDVIPLTPNCFLKPHSRTSMVWKTHDDTSLSETTPSRDVLIKSLQSSANLFEEYRTRWYEEYLLSLRETSRDLYQTSWKNRVKKDDIVIVRSPVKERAYWQLGIVSELIFGDDGKVRSAYVRAPGGKVNHHSIKYLYPLELSLTHSGSFQTNSSSRPSTVKKPTLPSSSLSISPSNSSPANSKFSLTDSSRETSRPRRLAAAAARLHFKDVSSESESESD